MTQTYVMLTKLGHDALKSSETLGRIEKAVTERVFAECKDIEWVANYAVFGPYDYLDIFTAPDAENAMRVATIERSFCHADTEIWPAVDWDKFKEIIQVLPGSETD